MGAEARQWLGYLPLLIFAAVMFWRFRSMSRARPLRVSLLWIRPTLILCIVGFALFGMHPALQGWLAFAGGLAVGSLIGVQRARMVRLHIEGEGAEARVMMRQSMVALLMILAIFVLRRLLFFSLGATSTPTGHPGAGALLLTDGMLGFAAGLICVQGIVLWLRARALVAAHRAGDPL